MRSQFHSRFPLSEAQINDMWANALIVLDTNVLGRMYRYKAKSADEFLGLLENIIDRVWIPYQVAWEYMNVKDTKIEENNKLYEKIVVNMRKNLTEAEREVNSIRDIGIHPHIDIESQISAVISSASTALRAVEENYNAASTKDYFISIHERIGNIFEGRTGAAPSTEQLQIWISNGNARFDGNIPPGLRDVETKRKKGRPEREVFGDYLIWEEILLKSEADFRDVIFVTEDAKDDWWLKEGGETVGPLPLLREEMMNRTQRNVHFYRASRFLKLAKEKFAATVSEDTIADIARDYARDEQQVHLSFFEEAEKLLRRHGATVPTLNYLGKTVFYFTLRSKLQEVYDSKIKQRDELIEFMRNNSRAIEQFAHEFEEPLPHGMNHDQGHLDIIQAGANAQEAINFLTHDIEEISRLASRPFF
ncbi:PIN-like domain-containing protein [Aureimonas sp. AU40]|uniref:PIN-like domain-containing protein n=1 Tax=Aureimonas sp. AU40 TaxID=1637747 RepID=UPI000A60314A|nr:PIN-like domain-containing protein [Aureimonas sp. AU40]